MTTPSAMPAGPESGLYLAIQGVTIYVRDVERSLSFYVGQLGLRVIYSHPEAERWTVLAPPDGTSTLSLVQPSSDSIEFGMIGSLRNVIFVTNDVDAKFREWSERRVSFVYSPKSEPWGGRVTAFRDPDGNSFVLVAHDAASREMTAHRRAKQEMEIAKDVQARMFPQALPSLKTLDYAGICVQARTVGGDYYDFIDLGNARLGLAVADVSGKGMPAALHMASLHAILRSHRDSVGSDPEAILRSVNQFFFENTANHEYVTLFFAEYNNQNRHLRYASCGHLSCILLRADSNVESLSSTCGVLGLFGEWQCSIAERQLSPGDLVAIYTDGATESFSDKGEEFGERRLLEALKQNGTLRAKEVVASVVDEIRQFSGQEQSDDITLMVAKCR